MTGHRAWGRIFANFNGVTALCGPRCDILKRIRNVDVTAAV
jgi:hypothetical protein